jgi:hypothetical protein
MQLTDFDVEAMSGQLCAHGCSGARDLGTSFMSEEAATFDREPANAIHLSGRFAERLWISKVNERGASQWIERADAVRRGTKRWPTAQKTWRPVDPGLPRP